MTEEVKTKEALKKIARRLHGLLLEDLTQTEEQIFRILEKEGYMQLTTKYGMQLIEVV